MKAMIMAAGVGSRLMPLTRQIPKPMAPVGNMPLMENILYLLQKHECSEIIANLHYRPDVIRSYFGDGRVFNVSLHYSPEDKLLGTAGGVKKCAWFLKDTFVIISGDVLTDVNLSYLLAAHKEKGALATIALKEVTNVEQYGIVVTDEKDRITDFQEKPKPSQALSNVANTGIYIFEPEIFDYIPQGQVYDFGKQLFPYLVKRKAPFFGVKITDYWCDIGSIATYRQANIDWLEGLVKTAVSPKDAIQGDNGSKVLMGDGVIRGKNVEISGKVVIGPGCRLGDNVLIKDSVIWSGTTIGNSVRVHEAVVGSNCNIAPHSEIGSNSAIGCQCQIPADQKIPPGSRLYTNGEGKLTELKE
jgi:mannose-1-phosphate guanylyltransferase